jgi:hypothetical protein
MDTNTCPCDLRALSATLPGYSTVEGVVVPHVRGGPLFWRCPGCGRRWHRDPPSHPLHLAARQYVDAGSPLPAGAQPRPALAPYVREALAYQRGVHPDFLPDPDDD